MVASALLGIIMVALFSGLAQGYLNLNTSRQDLRATQILEQKTEAVRLCLWTNINNLPNHFVEFYAGSMGTNSVAYHGTITVSDPTNIPDTVSYYDKIKLITISVSWTNYLHNRPVGHTREMQTLSAYYGMVNYIYGYTP